MDLLHVLSIAQMATMGHDTTQDTLAIVAIIVAAGSEIIGLLPIRSNSWVQLLLQALKLAFPKSRR